MIKLICLDLDGVFFDKAHDNLVNNLAKKYNLNKAFIEDVLFKKAAFEGGYNDLKTGKIKSMKYWNWLFSTLGINSTKQEYLDLLIKGYKINPKAVKLIKRWHKNGIKTAICSNNYKDNIENLEKKFHFFKFFDIRIFSYEEKVLKPDTKIFQTLIAKSGVRPSEIFLTDDKEQNIKSAKNLGIKTHLFTSFDSFISYIESLNI